MLHSFSPRVSPLVSRRPAAGGAVIAIATVAAAASLLTIGGEARAQTVNAAYASFYSITNLGTPTGVPGPLGGLTIKATDPDTLMIGGSANTSSAVIDQIGVTRDSGNHITGFSGTASQAATAPGTSGGIDGGLAYGPNNVLFYTTFADNNIGQIKVGSSSPDKLTGLTSLGVTSSVGSLLFVPNSFGGPNVGHLKIASYNGNTIYDAIVTDDGTGTYNIGAATLTATLSGGIEGLIYVPGGSPGFTNPAMLVAEYGTGAISAYDVNANGDPIAGTRRDFITGLSGAEGAYIDPLSGDFLFSTFNGGNQVIAVSGFAPTATAPEPGTLALLGTGVFPLACLAVRRRRARPVA